MQRTSGTQSPVWSVWQPPAPVERIRAQTSGRSVHPVLLHWTEAGAPPKAAPEVAASLTAAVKQVVSVSKHVHLSSCKQACNKSDPLLKQWFVFLVANQTVSLFLSRNK